MHVVQIVVCGAVCDVLEALLEPRPNGGSPIDPDIGNICVRLAFDQFNPVSDRAMQLSQALHSTLAAAMQQRTVVSWSKVVCHLTRSRFDQIVNEFIARIHSAKTSDDVLHILVRNWRLGAP